MQPWKAFAASMKVCDIAANAMLMPPEAEPVMPASAVTVTASLMFAVYAVINGNEVGWTSLATLWKLGTAIALMIAWMASGTRPGIAAFGGLPWYAWIGGVYGAIFVAVAAYAAPRIGLASLITVGIAGQIAMGWYAPYKIGRAKLLNPASSK